MTVRLPSIQVGVLVEDQAKKEGKSQLIMWTELGFSQASLPVEGYDNETLDDGKMIKGVYISYTVIELE